jgi:hypothetical protein
MRAVAITFVSMLTLLSPALAFAAGGGPVSPPAVGNADPVPAGTGEAGIPAANPAPGKAGTTLANGATDPLAAPAARGIDTSTAAPGGQAESSKNGALSTPADSDKTVKHHKKNKAPAKPDADTKS